MSERRLAHIPIFGIFPNGKPVGRIIPEGQSLEERVEALRQAGVIAWNGKKLKDIELPAINRAETASGLTRLQGRGIITQDNYRALLEQFHLDWE